MINEENIGIKIDKFKSNQNIFFGILILLLFICIISFIYIHLNDIVCTKDIENIEIHAKSEMETEIDVIKLNDEEKETFINFIELLNSAKGTKQNFSKDLSDISLLFKYKNGKIKVLDLYFDMQTQRLSFLDISKNKYYILDKKDSAYFFFYKHFQSVHSGYFVPSVDLYIGDKLINVYHKSFEWLYMCIDGSWAGRSYDKIFDVIDFKNDNSIIDLEKGEKLRLEYSVLPDKSHLQIVKEGNVIYDEDIYSDELPLIKEDGSYIYRLTNEWYKDEYEGTQVLEYDIYIDLPIEVYISKSSLLAGDTVSIVAKNVNPNEKIELIQDLSLKSPIFYTHGNKRIAFLGVSCIADSGKYNMKLSCLRDNKTTFEKEFDLEVKDTKFKVQNLTISKKLRANAVKDENRIEHKDYCDKVREKSENRILWDGDFIMPVKGVISTDYGEIRYVNGSTNAYRHKGIDIAAKLGTPIIAPNNGIVKGSKFLNLTGNSIIIDHGMGLFSVYYHLNSRDVKVGEYVKKGDIIGTVGKTGFSTGPHLHYEFCVFKTAVNPYLLMESDSIIDFINNLS